MVRHVVFAVLAVVAVAAVTVAFGNAMSCRPALAAPIKRGPEATHSLAGTALNATGPDKTVQRMAPPLGCDRLTIADGLPNSNVHAIVQDGSGFIWFGTQDGLVRYDGNKMRVYRPVEKDPTSISSGYITALTLDANGKLWVGTAEHGVNLYDPSTDQFTRFARDPSKGLTSE